MYDNAWIGQNSFFRTAQKFLFSSVHSLHCAVVIACMYPETEISHRATAIISSISRTLCGTTIMRRLKIIEPCHWEAYYISWVSLTLCGTTIEHRPRIIKFCHWGAYHIPWVYLTLCGTTIEHRPKIIGFCHRDHFCISRADFWCRMYYVSHYPKNEWLSTLSCVFVLVTLCVLVVLPSVLIQFEVLRDREQDSFSLFMNLSLYAYARVAAPI